MNEALLAYHFGGIKLHTPIKVAGVATDETTVGRLIFNEALAGPSGVTENHFAFVNDTMTKKKLGKLLGNVFNDHGADVTRDMIDRVKLLGFEMATAPASRGQWPTLSSRRRSRKFCSALKKKSNSSTSSTLKVCSPSRTPRPRHHDLGQDESRNRENHLRHFAADEFHLSDRRLRLPRFVGSADADDGYERLGAEPERRNHRTSC